MNKNIDKSLNIMAAVMMTGAISFAVFIFAAITGDKQLAPLLTTAGLFAGISIGYSFITILWLLNIRANDWKDAASNLPERQGITQYSLHVLGVDELGYLHVVYFDYINNYWGKSYDNGVVTRVIKWRYETW